MASVSVSVRPSGVRCALSVRYSSGSKQPDLATIPAVGGHARWTWRVPERAASGRATVTASCGRAGRVSRTMMIVGSVIPVRITVERKGFSIRAMPYGGTSVSYGLVLQNHSSTSDAVGVTVLTNFVMPDNKLIGSATTHVPVIGAGATYALGSELTFAGGVPLDRLEVVIQVAGRAPKAAFAPAVAAVRILPDLYDRGYVGSVEGELIHDRPGLVMQNARLSAVIFDAAGNVLGGGNGYAFASLPPGAREFFKISSGLKAIQLEKAAEAYVSVEPSYRPVG
jgi:hypothetical protein